jgi:hypothetical protein
LKALFTNPLLIGAFLTAYVTGATSILTSTNSRQQMEADAANRDGLLKLERLKFESSVVLEAIKSGGPDKAAANLDFLLKTGLLPDSDGRFKKYLENRGHAEGVALPNKR